MSRPLVLALETSCDETAAAVVRDGREVMSSVVSSQVDLHAEYGGVVPEIAGRAHLELLTPVIDAALHLFARYNGCLQRVVDGKKYLLEDKPVDEAYEKLRLSDADGNEFDSLADAFISAASSELHSTGLQR